MSDLQLMAALLKTPGYGQTLPAFRWTLEVDGSGVDRLAGLGTDAAGNSTRPETSFIQRSSAAVGTTWLLR